MTEKKTSLKVPDAFSALLEDVRFLKSDGQNPNAMTDKQKEETWNSLKEFGWVYPILTNTEGMFANGEQRVSVSISHGEYFAPVLRLSLTDGKRRLLRKITNQLHGKHNKKLDQEDQMRIVAFGLRDDLAGIQEAIGEKMAGALERMPGSHMIPETYELIVDCKDETEQRTRFEELQVKGWKVKVLNL